MKRLTTISVLAAALIIASIPFGAGLADKQVSPIFGIKLPAGYRDWKLISVAHEEGNLNDLRAILGNDVAISAFREVKQEFPDGTIIARLAWDFVPSEENNKAFGRRQSFVAGLPKEGVQFMVKDSTKYASTGGWGSRDSTTANRPAGQCSKHAFLVMSLRRGVTSSLRTTHLQREQKPRRKRLSQM